MLIHPPGAITTVARLDAGKDVWNADSLRSVLVGRVCGRSDDWLSRLPRRKRLEREFHNASKQTREKQNLPGEEYEHLHGNKKYYSVVHSSRAFLRHWLAEHVRGRIFLDYACGNGDQTVQAAQLGAALAVGIDISEVSIGKGREQARTAGVEERCIFVQGDCESTGFADECIDVALCSGMLHHLDLSHALPELRRILKPGGVVMAVEALNYNPAIRLYRLLTPQMRTEWEKHHILSLADVKFASRFFEVRNVRYWHLLSLLAVPVRSKPKLFDVALNFLDRLDSLVLRIPGIRLMSWQFTFELVKPAEP